jgi:hypothetical protein
LKSATPMQINSITKACNKKNEAVSKINETVFLCLLFFVTVLG